MKKKVLVNSPEFYGIDRSILNAFKRSGFETILLNIRVRLTFQERAAKILGRKIPFLKFFFDLILKYYLNKENKELISCIKREKPDLIFVIKGDQIFPETLQIINNKLSIPIVAYIWDDPFYSYAGNFADNYRKSNFVKGMFYYDYIFVYDRYYTRKIMEHGIKNVKYLPLATDPEVYSPIHVNKNEKGQYEYDICFVGRPYPNRVEVLEKLKDYNLGVFGDGWKFFFLKKGHLLPSYYKGKATGEKVNKIYCSSKIILNIHDPEAKEGLNTRTFDILACGAFELVDFKKIIKKHLTIGKEIVVYKSINEIRKVIDQYLAVPSKRNKIVKNGMKRVLNEHTWLHRVRKVIDTLNRNKIIDF